MTINEAIKQTEKAAIEFANATRQAAKDRNVGFWSSPEYKALNEATVMTIGRVTVRATVGGNSVRQHVRHTFKIDGKRATALQAMELT